MRNLMRREICGARRMSHARRCANTERLFTLYDQYSARLYGLAIAMLGNAAEAQDATVEALLNAWCKTPPTDADHESMYAWLVCLVRAEAITIVRARTMRGTSLRGQQKPGVHANG